MIPARTTLWAASALALFGAGPGPATAPAGAMQDPARPVEPAASSQSSDEVARKLAEAFAAEGILLDAARGHLSVPAEVLVRGDLLEYLVVNPRGAVHESAFVTSVSASRIHAALLALGVQQGTNARWKRRDPPPTLEEIRDGVPPFDVTPPEGGAVFLYVAWRLGGEVYFHRMEDLILDLATGATMRRHPWAFLGSRMVTLRNGDSAFAADLEGNLVNIAFFEAGNTLVTAALPECVDQTIWQANFWLLPERGSAVELVFARERLAVCPPAVEARLQEAIRVEAPGSR